MRNFDVTAYMDFSDVENPLQNDLVANTNALMDAIGDVPFYRLFSKNIEDVCKDVGVDPTILAFWKIEPWNSNPNFRHFRTHEGSSSDASLETARDRLLQACGDLTYRDIMTKPRKIFTDEVISAIKQAVDSGIIPLAKNNRCCNESDVVPACNARRGKTCSKTPTGLCTAVSDVC